MNQEVSVTNPAPPTGVTPTEVPLGITGTTALVPAPLNVSYNIPTQFSLDEAIYIDTFTISKTNLSRDRVFRWTSLYPLGDSLNPYTSVALNGTNQYTLPWDLIRPFYSRQCKIDWEINFTFVKVADARCSIDIVFNYNDNFVSPTNDLTLNNDSYHVIIDSQDQNFSFKVPMFWLSNNINTNTFSAQFALQPSSIQPAFLPATNFQVYIRNPYQPNQLQPDSFDVVVTARPIVHSAIGFATMSPKTLTILSTSITEVSKPYFLRASNV